MTGEFRTLTQKALQHLVEWVTLPVTGYSLPETFVCGQVCSTSLGNIISGQHTRIRPILHPLLIARKNILGPKMAPWSSKVTKRFSAVPVNAPENDYYASYNKLLNSLFPPDSDYTVVPRQTSAFLGDKRVEEDNP
ncbi:hypothetical protein EDB86DRAFT_2835749 [Lactarius hatsudake]|nr:hypothetical protein EDB86DRAFT_2835749 [Lactarius hatsudake]